MGVVGDGLHMLVACGCLVGCGWRLVDGGLWVGCWMVVSQWRVVGGGKLIGVLNDGL